jgi:uncharacterized protein (DUF58 family)
LYDPRVRLVRLALGVVCVASIALAVALPQPWRSWLLVAFFTTLVAWALAAAGHFFLVEGERGARVDPDRVEAARWIAGEPGAMQVTLRGRGGGVGRTERLDGEIALAMAAALESRGVRVEGEPPGEQSPPAPGGPAFVDSTGKLQRR